MGNIRVSDSELNPVNELELTIDEFELIELLLIEVSINICSRSIVGSGCGDPHENSDP